jgi:hypothetical protein
MSGLTCGGGGGANGRALLYKLICSTLLLYFSLTQTFKYHLLSIYHLGARGRAVG